MEDKYIVAIEIGSSKIKGALGLIQPSGLLNVIAVREEPLVDSVRYGQIKNVEDVSNTIDRIRRNLECTPSIMPNKIQGVYVGLGGLTLGSTIATAEINFDRESEITSSTIADLQNRALASIFTSKETYSTVARDFTVDNMATSNPVGTFGSSIKGSFVVISGSTGLMSNINRVFPERLQLAINAPIVSATAQAEAVLSPDERRLGCLFVDFGAETTTVSIYKNGTIQYLVTLPMGSRNITRDLIALTYLEERAEDIKRSLGVMVQGDDSPRIASPEGMDQPEINNYISARTGEIIANILAQIEFAGFKATDLPAGIITVGGGARMKGFSDLLARRSNMNVRPGIAPRSLRVTDTSILVDDAIDVIALLLAAAKRDDVKNCVDNEASAADDHARVSASVAHHDDDYDDDSSRIGIDDDDDVLLDDDDDSYVRSSKKGKKPNAKIQAEITRAEEKERERVRRGPSIFARLKNAIGNAISDPDDKFDEEEE